ncbi:MAG TPA: polysaccharide deacetylase family protein [Anaerolineaceae bacterium]|nr:polysaccharide deacetylase family protein [Anaerolineaceae bacterium]
MDVKSWFKKRGLKFILQRGRSLLDGYGLTAARSMRRVSVLMDLFDVFGCHPTFAVPGQVADRHPAFILDLQARGAEIAVHSYHHIDLNSIPPEAASQELQRAADCFEQLGLTAHGFRCPYLSCSSNLLQALPPGLFAYSSNRAVRWSLPFTDDAANPDQHVFETINRFYAPLSAANISCLPWLESGLVEIPVSIPDDLQMHQGLGYTALGVSQAWIDILRRTHARGEVFTLMFHPELAAFCAEPLVALLEAARELRPGVWITRLQDVAAWWRQKSTLRPQIVEETDTSITLNLPAASGALWVERGLDRPVAAFWDSGYTRLTAGLNYLPANPRPFIGLPPDISPAIKNSLQNQGYLLDQTETAPRCAIYLDSATLNTFTDENAIGAKIERMPGPVIRLWPWPNGMRSALCITGDLDALSLLDYAARLTPA